MATIARISLVVKEMIFIIALEITEYLFIMISSSDDFLIFILLVCYYPCQAGILNYALK